MLRPTEIPLSQLGRRQLVDGVDFHAALANFPLAAVVAENVLHKPNDKSSHSALLVSIHAKT
jgi:hypothetical protein